MNTKVLQTLEFNQIRKRLASLTQTAVGREMAFRLKPSSHLEVIQAWQEETSEARRLLERQLGLFLEEVKDEREVIRQAQRCGILLPEDFLDILVVARVGTRIKRTLIKAPLPHFHLRTSRIGNFEALTRKITAVIGEQGEIRDRASPRLAQIRQDITRAHQRLQDHLEGLVRSSQVSRYLQEPVVTLREGRYVLPVRREHKSQVPGIVHDESASGATLFIEPLSAVDLNNRWHALQMEERKEIEIILKKLSKEVAGEGEKLLAALTALAEIDFCLAKGRLSLAQEAVSPILNQDKYLRLVDARHPLLTGEVVPISVELGKDFALLVITGPNTGGKTVSLKTIGLLTLMAQAGLHIPAAQGSEVAVFDQVFSDIGDEQSIAQNLSTFSSHMINIIRILKHLNANSLVLLDELGAGTDPAEGSALGIALLEFLLEQEVVGAVTTHHQEVKYFAHITPGLMNASVEFDLETLSPTYKLSIGLPGASKALAVAARLGLPQGIIGAAEGQLSSSQRRLEEVLKEIEEHRVELEQALKEASLAREEAEHFRASLREELSGIEAEKESILAEAREKALEWVEGFKDRLNALERELEIREVSREWLTGAKSEVERIAAEVPPPPLVKAAALPVEIGQIVRVQGWKDPGRIVSLRKRKGEAEVLIGEIRLKVKTDQLETAEAAPLLPSPRPYVRPEREVSVELDLHGYRVSDVEPRLDRYLNDAFLAGLSQVRIIHGFGTGTLRRAVREVLSSHPLVKGFRSAGPWEGGEGVTVVDL